MIFLYFSKLGKNMMNKQKKTIRKEVCEMICKGEKMLDS